MEFYQKHDLEGRKHCGNNEWNILVSVDYSMRVQLINFYESKDEVFPHYRSSLCQSHFTELFNGWGWLPESYGALRNYLVRQLLLCRSGQAKLRKVREQIFFRSHERRCESEERSSMGKSKLQWCIGYSSLWISRKSEVIGLVRYHLS